MKTINEFLDYLKEQNVNKVHGDSAIVELFGDDSNFAIICKKCGSLDVEIIGERGINYGGQTGYSEGATVVKCNGCGAATTIWE